MSQRRVVPLNVLARSTAPTGSRAGDMYYNTTDARTYVYTGTSWVAIQDNVASSNVEPLLLIGA